MADGEEEEIMNNIFGCQLKELEDLVEKYRSREFDEDLKAIKQDFNGIEGLAERLHTDTVKGIVPNDLDDRDSAFGSNKKDPPKRNGF